jgi:hypothetical protein
MPLSTHPLVVSVSGIDPQRVELNALSSLNCQVKRIGDPANALNLSIRTTEQVPGP